MQSQPSTGEYRDHDADPYAINLAGLVAFNPTYRELRETLGPTVAVAEPNMLGGPQLSLSAGATGEKSPNPSRTNESVVIKVDVSGHDHVTCRGHDITDQQAAELLGITEPAFARGHDLAGAGLRQGLAAMDNLDPAADSPTAPHAVVESRAPQQGPALVRAETAHQRCGPNLGIGSHR